MRSNKRFSNEIRLEPNSMSPAVHRFSCWKDCPFLKLDTQRSIDEKKIGWIDKIELILWNGELHTKSSCWKIHHQSSRPAQGEAKEAKINDKKTLTSEKFVAQMIWNLSMRKNGQNTPFFPLRFHDSSFVVAIVVDVIVRCVRRRKFNYLTLLCGAGSTEKQPGSFVEPNL